MFYSVITCYIRVLEHYNTYALRGCRLIVNRIDTIPELYKVYALRGCRLIVNCIYTVPELYKVYALRGLYSPNSIYSASPTALKAAKNTYTPVAPAASRITPATILQTIALRLFPRA